MKGNASMTLNTCNPSDAKATSSAKVKSDRPDVFQHQDYRRYLLGMIEYRRLLRPSYRRSDFAKAIGFSSESGINMILSGKRELRPPYLDRCIANLRLNVSERIYFEALIRASAMSPSQRRGLLRDVEILAGRWEPPAAADGIRLLDFCIVQQILCLAGKPLSLGEILMRFRYTVTPEELAAVLNWMIKQGYVSREGDEFRMVQSVMTSKDELSNAALRKVHTDALKLAANALETDPIESREFQTYFFTMDRQRLAELKVKIKQMVIALITEFETELDADTVMQMHFNLFEAIDRSKGKA